MHLRLLSLSILTVSVFTFIPVSASKAQTPTSVIRAGDRIIASVRLFEGNDPLAHALIQVLLLDALGVPIAERSATTDENGNASARFQMPWEGNFYNPWAITVNYQNISVGQTSFNVFLYNRPMGLKPIDRFSFMVRFGVNPVPPLSLDIFRNPASGSLASVLRLTPPLLPTLMLELLEKCTGGRCQQPRVEEPSEEPFFWSESPPPLPKPPKPPEELVHPPLVIKPLNLWPYEPDWFESKQYRNFGICYRLNSWSSLGDYWIGGRVCGTPFSFEVGIHAKPGVVKVPGEKELGGWVGVGLGADF